MTKIALVVPTISRTGAGVSEIARLSAEAILTVPGFEVEVISLQDQYSESDKKLWSNIRITDFPYHGPSKYGFSPELENYLIHSDADLVHVHSLWMHHCYAVKRWHQKTRKPYVITPHGMLEPWIIKRSPALKKIISLLYQDSFIRNARMLQAGSEKEVADIHRLYPDTPTQVIANYVKRRTPSTTAPPWITEELKGKKIFLFLSRIHEKKGCFELLSAWDTFCSSYTDLAKDKALVFCGWIDGVSGFEEAVLSVRQKYGNVAYVGPQFGEDKYRSLDYCDFYILPSKSEGLPIAILEAWQSDLVVLMTEECNLSIGFKQNGAIRIDPTPEKITDGLVKASSLTEEEISSMKKQGKTIVQSHFSQEIIAQQLTNLYKTLV